jgi:hypothetical protein
MTYSPAPADWLRDRPALQTLFEGHAARETAISAHLGRLRHIASDCTSVTEFGMRKGASTCAFLLAARSVLSIDNKPVADAVNTLKRLAGDAWRFIPGDTTQIDPIPECDLLFIDADHTFTSVHAELTRHADRARQWLIFHDTITFGSVGADGESGRQRWQYSPGATVPIDALGIRPAIDHLMIRDPSWRIYAHYLDSHGLLVLRRA